ncbi:hypothetical protein [Ideonella sp. YS5]|uniref:hypothetical protein n=1 Tax=Ideonella sp. YS5 TaxID=3453714 RepID=UPI003EEA59BC
MRQMTWMVAVLAAAALAACGGGGGDDSGDDGTGLVPTPPALGATLAADATTLRPLVPGAVWQYSGTNASGGSYENTVSHASATPGVTETGTNTFDTGAGSVHVVAVNGSILQPDPEDVDGDGVADVSNLVELRSPVRVNDQIVAFDERIPNLVPDVDGDGRAEFFDLAIYSRVIGAEDVALEGLPTQSAVRVDHIVIGRVVLSKDGTKLPSVSSTQSIWYAPDLGIVRRRLDAPSDDGLSREVTDERLTGWSGLPG